jgi:hypothetical protein
MNLATNGPASSARDEVAIQKDEHEGAEPSQDDEPSLGFFDHVFDQRVSRDVSRSSQLNWDASRR